MATLGSQAVGSIVKLNENGSPVEFYVAKHDYENGLNGSGRTLVVRKDCYDTRVFSNSNNAFSGSAIDTWLNNTYLHLLDSDIQTAIGTTKFYCLAGNGSSTKNTLQRAVFLLSATELNKGSYNDGAALSIASTLQIAYCNGRASTQWTRTPSTGHTSYVYFLGTNGTLNYFTCSNSYGSRPAFTLPSTLSVSDDGTVSPEPPDPLAPKDGHNTLVSGAACQIEGGTVMIGGTAYELESGTVVIGGTVYEIPFAGGTCIVTITGSGRDGFCYVEIDGQSYMSANVVEVAKGTGINCAAARLGNTNGYIYLNGVLVASTESGTSTATYQYTVRGDVSIELRITDTTSNQKRSIYIVDT